MRSFLKKPEVSVIGVICIVLVSAGLTCRAGVAPAGLKDALKGKFLIGVAMSNGQITGDVARTQGLIAKHFNSIVAENGMKHESLQPREGVFDFSLADAFVAFGEKQCLHIVGHTLVWHSQVAGWFFVDGQGNPVTRDALIERMRLHITTVVSRYKGRVAGWDVVNEAINDDGSWRQSPFYTIIGADYIRLAFQFARDADPKAELYYNDYSMAKPGRRDAVVRMVRQLKQQGVRVDGIGMQGHMTMDYPALKDFETSIVAFVGTGAKVMITELDMTVLPPPDRDTGADVARNFAYDSALNPYADGLPGSVETALHDRYASFFRLFLKHRNMISRVTVWGLNDAQSWRNDWPVKGRTDYPLLFDRDLKPKPIVETIIREASE